MTINAFRGDCEARAKVVRLEQPNNTIGVFPTVRVNNKTIEFENWDAAAIANEIEGSDFAELDEIAAIASGGNVEATGPEDEDFVFSFTQTPTAVVVNVPGANPTSQSTLINFAGAAGGTYTLTLDGETTSAIAFGNISDARTKLAALASFASTDFDLIASGSDYLLTFKGTYAATAVDVTVNGGGLTNVVGSLIFEKTADAIPDRYDTFLLCVKGSNSCVVDIDGNTDRIYSDDSLATIRTKLQALTTSGKLVNVWGGESTPLGGILCVVEFEGYTTAVRPSFSVVSSIVTNGAEIKSLYNPTSGISSDLIGAPYARGELIMIDFSESNGTMQVVIDGVAIQVVNGTAASIATQLNTASDYVEWTGAETVTFTNAATLGAIASGHSKMHFLFWSREDLYSVSDVPKTYIRKTGGAGTFKVLANGGTSVSGAVVEVYRTPSTITGGTFTLTFDEGTTSAIAWNADASTVQSAVAAVVSGSTVASGDGSAGSPWEISIDSGSTDPDQTPTGSPSFTGQGTASVSHTITATPGTSGSATVTVSTRAASGTYGLKFASEGPIAFGPGIDAAAFKALLERLPSLADTGDTSVTWDESAGIYEISFTGNLANQTVGSFSIPSAGIELATASDETNTIVIQTASGPGNFGDARNWTLGRLPETGDDVVIDSSNAALTYGLRHYVETTVDDGTDWFTSAVGHDFVPNQKIQFFGATLPSPLTPDTDYFVLSPDYTRGRFQVSATVNGPAVDVAEAGTCFAGVRLRALRILSTFTDQIGLTENHSAGYRENRNRYLRIGVDETVDIGAGAGSGSGLIRIDFGDSGPIVRVISTGNGVESGFGAVNILAQSQELRFATQQGSASVAAGDDEEATIADVGLHGGETIFGAVTVLRDFLLNAGSFSSRDLSVVGMVRVNG